LLVFTAVMMMMLFFWVLALDLEVEKVRFSETLSSTDERTRRQNPEEQHHNLREYQFTASAGWEVINW
jgi:hypothetical protein